MFYDRTPCIIFRSTSIGRYEFYTKQKTLIHDIIMYHLPVLPDQVRLAIVTFAADAELVVDGISNEPFTKCELCQEGGYWEKVIYNTEYVYSEDGYILNDSVSEDSSMKRALMKASIVLDAGMFTKVFLPRNLPGKCSCWLTVSVSLSNKLQTSCKKKCKETWIRMKEYVSEMQ